jgi:hypothetical protein
MKKNSFPRRIVVQLLRSEDGYLPDLLAWSSLQAADDGQLAIYELVEKIEKKSVPKIGAGKTEQWAETEELNA